MLFHLFCMLHDYWRIAHRSQDSAGKSTVRMQYFGRSAIDRNYTENLIFPEDGDSQKEEPRRAAMGPPIGRRGPRPGRAALWGGGPQPPLASSPSRTSSPRKPKLRGRIARSHSRLCGAENTREKRALRQAQICRGNSLPEGEIDAIVTVIELDIIFIIITAVSTAAPHHRCSNLGLILIV